MDINTLKFRFYESIENKALAAEYKKVKDIFPNTSHTEERQETVIVPHDDGRPDEERVIKNIIDAVFANDLDIAQDLITNETERRFNLMGRKGKMASIRDYI